MHTQPRKTPTIRRKVDFNKNWCDQVCVALAGERYSAKAIAHGIGDLNENQVRYRLQVAGVVLREERNPTVRKMREIARAMHVTRDLKVRIMKAAQVAKALQRRAA